MRARLAPVTLAVAIVALAVAPAALAGNGGIAPPDSATASGSQINDLWWILMGILVTIFVLVEGALLWFVFRYRRRRGQAPETEGPQVHGHTRIELVWTAIPTAILIVLMVVTIVMVPTVEANPGPGEDPLVVDVTAHQFYWEYTYPNGVVTVDTLRLPVDRPVQLVLNAADVIHSWWVPELTGKRDAIPGRTNELNFTVSKTGVFEGQCAELCGVQHAIMSTTVEVVAAAEFDAWLEERGGSAGRRGVRARPADVGRDLREVPRARRHRRLRSGDRRQHAAHRRAGAGEPSRRGPRPGQHPRLYAAHLDRMAGRAAAGAHRLHRRDAGAGPAGSGAGSD